MKIELVAMFLAGVLLGTAVSLLIERKNDRDLHDCKSTAQVAINAAKDWRRLYYSYNTWLTASPTPIPDEN